MKNPPAEERDIALRTGTQSDDLLASYTTVGKHPEFYEFFLYPPTKQVVRQTFGANALLPHAAGASQNGGDLPACLIFFRALRGPSHS